MAVALVHAIAKRGEKMRGPREKPEEMEKPECDLRHGIVVPRVAHIEEAEDVLVEEVKPKEAMVFARQTAWSRSK